MLLDGRPAIRVDKPKECYHCKKLLIESSKFCCGLCRSVYYCSKDCQIVSWKYHKVVCQSIAQLATQQRENNNKRGSYVNNFTIKEQSEIADIVGEKCLIECELNGVSSTLLLDSGAQVSILSYDFLLSNLTDVQPNPLSDILDQHDSLRVQWGNNADIPFTGFVTLNVCFKSGEHNKTIAVPFLVTTDKLNNPILGFNAIKHLSSSAPDKSILIELFKTSFKGKTMDQLQTFVHLIQSADDDTDGEEVVRVKGKDFILPPGRLVQVSCKTNVGRVNAERPMMFHQGEVELPEGLECVDSLVMLKKGTSNYFKILVMNTTKHDKTLRKNTIIGRLEYVNSVIPLDVKKQSLDNKKQVNLMQVSKDEDKNIRSKHHHIKHQRESKHHKTPTKCLIKC